MLAEYGTSVSRPDWRLLARVNRGARVLGPASRRSPVCSSGIGGPIAQKRPEQYHYGVQAGRALPTPRQVPTPALACSGAMAAERVRDVVIKRRAFLAVLGGSLGLMAARVALLPRPLSDEEVVRLQSGRYVPNNPRIKPVPTVDPTSGLATNFSASSHQKVQELELVPRRPRWQRSFKINTVERDPQPNLDAWSLDIGGLVERPIRLSLETLPTALPTESQVHDFHCVEGWGVQDVEWHGIPFRALAEAVQPLPGAVFVTFTTMGGIYSDSLALDQATEPSVLLAFRLNGQALPHRQGYPCRLVVPQMFGYKSVKWVTRIVFTDQRHVGFWERRGWPLDPWV